MVDVLKKLGRTPLLASLALFLGCVDARYQPWSEVAVVILSQLDSPCVLLRPIVLIWVSVISQLSFVMVLSSTSALSSCISRSCWDPTASRHKSRFRTKHRPELQVWQSERGDQCIPEKETHGNSPAMTKYGAYQCKVLLHPFNAFRSLRLLEPHIQPQQRAVRRRSVAPCILCTSRTTVAVNSILLSACHCFCIQSSKNTG